VDLGLRNLAVVNCEGETLFFSGDRAAFVRRKFNALRRRMGKAKALGAIRRMKDKDHEISRKIVDRCIARGVGTIRMEDLTGIRIRGNRNRKDRGRSLHSWSFYRLKQFTIYKANLAGIKVEWVVPANTSRTCPACGVVDQASRNGIRFKCVACGHAEHADSVGAANIARAISGLAAA
jgi:putative transposase